MVRPGAKAKQNRRMNQSENGGQALDSDTLHLYHVLSGSADSLAIPKYDTKTSTYYPLAWGGSVGSFSLIIQKHFETFFGCDLALYKYKLIEQSID